MLRVHFDMVFDAMKICSRLSYSGCECGGRIVVYIFVNMVVLSDGASLPRYNVLCSCNY